jgi:hypothetical protein
MKKITIIIATILLGVSNIFAQGENKSEKTNSAAQANNPLANMTAVNFHIRSCRIIIAAAFKYHVYSRIFNKLPRSKL